MKPSVILYNPMSSPSRKKILPMSLLALGAVLEGRHEYSILDGNDTPNPLGAIRERVRQGANVIAVTVMPGPQLAQAWPVCRELKREFPGLIIVWGGYFPTLHASACLNSPEIDYVVQGHGEAVFPELMDLIASGGDPAGLQGLACRREKGAACANPPAPLPDPRLLPAFPYDRIDISRYVRSTFLGSRTLPHHSSYGCPFACNFCAVAAVSQARWLAQTAEQVAGIAGYYRKRWQVNAIEFHDNNFFVQEGRVAEFADRILRFGMAWWGEGRVDTLSGFSESTWRLMAQSGLKMVFMGAETSSLQTLHLMGKGGTLAPESTLEICARARRHGIVPEFSFVIGNPPDPDADVEAAFQFIRRLKKINPACEIILYTYAPVPLEGGMLRAASAYGFAFPDTLEEWASPRWREFAARRSAGVPWFSERLKRRVRNFERVLNACYPTSTRPGPGAVARALLRGAGFWRYYSGIHAFPLELRVLQRCFHYRRPETTGF